MRSMFYKINGYLRTIHQYSIRVHRCIKISQQAKNRNLGEYPIGLLGDIELHFLHYKDRTEALDKWNRRKERIYFNNLKFILTDKDLLDDNNIKKFDSSSRSKICFTANSYRNYHSTIQIKKYKNRKEIGNLFNNLYLLNSEINIINWLTS